MNVPSYMTGGGTLPVMVPERDRSPRGAAVDIPPRERGGWKEPQRLPDAQQLALRLQRQAGNRLARRALARVHFPNLKAVMKGYSTETATAAGFVGAVKQKITICEKAYDEIRKHPGHVSVTLAPATVPGISMLGGAWDPVAKTTTMLGREWQALLNYWRNVLNENYFSAPPGPLPSVYAGRLPHNFKLTPAQEAWLAHTMSTQGVQRDSPAEQASSEVTVSGGRLWRATPGRPRAVDTHDSLTWFKGRGWEIFVLSHDGHLHMASHLAGRRHHSSLLGAHATSPTQAKDSAGAGEMLVRDGKITELTVKTGHYQAGLAQLRQTVHLLTKRGANLSGTKLLSFDGSLVATDAASWWQTDAEGRSKFEREKTDRALAWYQQEYGNGAVNAALQSLGWVYVQDPVDHLWYWQTPLPGGHYATTGDIRKALKSRFPRHWEPETTRSRPADWTGPRPPKRVPTHV